MEQRGLEYRQDAGHEPEMVQLSRHYANKLEQLNALRSAEYISEEEYRIRRHRLILQASGFGQQGL